MKLHGEVLGIPYDLRFPTWERLEERMWNPDDPRVIVPRVFGAGWTINLASLRAKSRLALFAVLAIYAVGLFKAVQGTVRLIRGGYR